ncbi:30S ribosomal protein S12 methylthiotransferase RimO [Bacteriovoracaceae bacterium]|nr:30S ribosomal protein S12 methylthiotransferase RimO [Bacteriovoracaceae bacterium]
MRDMNHTADSDRSVYFTSLGCSKNLVDSQVMLGHLVQDKFKVVNDPTEAKVIVVNTCSFVEAAKKESIETVLELADFKNLEKGQCEALVMSGCMSQRYSHDLEAEIPEVDLFIGTGEYSKISQLLSLLKDGKLEKKSFVDVPKYIHSELDPRINTNPGHMAYLKVSEGCDRNCTFCIIPTLRGSLRSRSIESLVKEAKALGEKGVRELNLISQDFSSYGKDLIGEKEKGIASNQIYPLLSALSEVEEIDWLRIFYFYPDDLTEDVMDLIASNSKICHYLDMPIQHFSNKMLKRMNRFITGEEIVNKIKILREKIPNIVLRTSVIVGFPGETEEDFQTLLNAVIELKFDHLGVFKYSDEEGTPAFRLPEKIDQETINDRYQQVYEAQKEIVEEKNQSMLGEVMEVLVEGPHPETDLLIVGRSKGQAPDIDGMIIINDGLAYPGDMVSVKITEAHEYDLIGKIIPSDK